METIKITPGHSRGERFFALTRGMETMKLTLGHSPDADDAFMFYALAGKLIDARQYEFTHNLLDIETLNEKARNEELDITAISLHNYPYIHNNYKILSSGVSMGDNYGPILVCNEDNIPGDLSDISIGIPGKHTTAYLVLQFLVDNPRVVDIRFDEIIPAVTEKRVDAGLVIHEGQLTYKEHHLHKICDLGEWWQEKFKRPLPLGINVIHNRIPLKEQEEISDILRESIKFSLEHPDDALEYARQYSGEMKREDIRKFVRMYVNDYTVNYGEKGEESVRFLLTESARRGYLPEIPTPVFV